MADPEIDARIRASFARQTMMTTLGAELQTVAPGLVTITAPLAPHVQQQQGAGHAALAFAIGDSAAGYAALSLMPEGREVVTAEIKINLLAPALGKGLIAEGRVIRAGKRLCVVAADVWAQDATGTRSHIAVLQGTMVPVPMLR